MTDNFRVRLLGTIVVALSAFGLYECLHAVIVAVRGGTHDLDGAFDYPLWAMAHFVGGIVFMSLMPFQLWAGFRNRHRQFHRRSGRVLFCAGFISAASGFALPFTMPDRPVSEKVFMTLFSVVFGFLLVQALRAARNRDFVRHREWIFRAVAVAFGPLMQRLIFPVFFVGLGVHSMPEFWEYFMTSAWLSAAVTLSPAEWWIRSVPARPAMALRHEKADPSADAEPSQATG